MIAPRFLTTTCVLIAIALVPAIAHTYFDASGNAGRTVSIPEPLAGQLSMASDRKPEWGMRRFGSDDWVERRYVIGRDDVVLTIVRSYDLKSLYHHPELAVAYRTPFGPESTRRSESHPAIPVHVLPGEGDSSAVAMYVLAYGGRYIDDPLWFQVRTMGELLIRSRRPLTLYFVKDTNRDGRDPMELRSASLLLAAVDRDAREARP